MIAGVLQVFCLMWLRTAMNYQYFHGGSLRDTVSSLWAEGGVRRFYQGVGFALLQAPLARGGDTFVQTGIVTLMGSPGQHVHGFWTGLVVATIAACWRLCVAPLDVLKVTAQVHGSSANKIFWQRFRLSGILELWSGATAMFLVIWIGSFPWWAVYNTALELWPQPSSPTMLIMRNGLAGVVASMASDVASNSLRVLKVKRQATVEGSIGVEGYFADARDVLMKEGAAGLLFRGIGAKMLTGALQGAFFSVLWNLMMGWMGVQSGPIAPAAHLRA